MKLKINKYDLGLIYKHFNIFNQLVNGQNHKGQYGIGVFNVSTFNKHYDDINQFFTKDTKYIFLRSRRVRNNHYTINTFREQARKSNSVCGYNGFWVDLDVEQYGINKDYFKTFFPDILYEVFNNNVQPTSIQDSGEGYYVYYMLDEQLRSNSIQIDKLWRAIEHALLQRFHKAILKYIGQSGRWIVDFGSGEPAHLLRIPGTYNQKSGGKGRQSFIYQCSGQTYTLDYMCRLLPKRTKQQKEIAKRKFNILNNKSSKNYLKLKMNKYTLNLSRLKDIYTLTNMRNYNLNGCREYSLFIICLCLNVCGYHKSSNSKIETFNNNLKYPLKQTEIQKLQRENSYNEKLIDGTYNITNIRIIEKLHIRLLEQKSLITLISPIEKKRRQKNRMRRLRNKRNKGNSKHYRDNKMKELKKEGYSNRKIAKILSISRNTVNSHLRK